MSSVSPGVYENVEKLLRMKPDNFKPQPWGGCVVWHSSAPEEKLILMSTEWRTVRRIYERTAHIRAMNVDNVQPVPGGYIVWNSSKPEEAELMTDTMWLHYLLTEGK